MAKNERSELKRYQYVDDRGDLWYIELTEAIAEIGGFSEAPPPNVIPLPKWPHDKTWLRSVRLIYQDEAGNRKAKIVPVPRLDNNLYKGVTKITNINGMLFTVVSRLGEISTYTGPSIYQSFPV